MAPWSNPRGGVEKGENSGGWQDGNGGQSEGMGLQWMSLELVLLVVLLKGDSLYCLNWFSYKTIFIALWVEYW
jgi:hypothetical protein